MRHNFYLFIVASFLTVGCRIPLESNASRVKDAEEDPSKILMAMVKFDAATESLSLSSSEKVNFLSVVPSLETDNAGLVDGKTVTGEVIKEASVSLRNIKVSVESKLAKGEVTCVTQKASLGMLVSSVEVKFVCDQPINAVAGKDKPDSVNGKMNESTAEQGKTSTMAIKGTCACKINEASKSEVPALFDMPAKKDCRALIDASYGEPIPDSRKKYKICYYVSAAPSPSPSQSTQQNTGPSTGSSSSAKFCKCSFVESKTGEMVEFKDNTSLSSCMAKSGTMQPNKAGVRMTTTGCKLQ
ncbi:MAG: hypothetical protein NT027_08040 [Proteobacteria bacterium]|nr:hypothetical protein [Pseudomonadota bacterium]